jgi:hypothetical protein
MPLPAFYTEALFADFLVGVLGEVADAIGWDAGSVQVLEAVNDALLHYGTTAITSVTSSDGMYKLRALGKRAIWRAVAQNVASRYDFQDSDAKFTRSQVQAMALKAIDIADAECAEAGASGLSIGRLTLDFLEPARCGW